jgi:hypothetical protein
MLDPCPNAKLRAIIRKRGCIGKILALLHDSTLDIELRVSAAGILQVRLLLSRIPMGAHRRSQALS